MEERVKQFFEEQNIEFEDILYGIHKDSLTHIYTKNGIDIITKIPLKHIFEYLPKSAFRNIQKGIVVAIQYIDKIDDTGTYTMVDGVTFKGRSRNPAEHKRLRKLLEKSARERKQKNNSLNQIYQKCEIMNEAPIAFCIIELVFNENGNGIDFIFRYCNKELEILDGIPMNKLINHSFYEVFANGDKKWIIPFADVALNGEKKVISDFSPELNKDLTIYCFQPQYGFCACLLTDKH